MLILSHLDRIEPYTMTACVRCFRFSYYFAFFFTSSSHLHSVCVYVLLIHIWLAIAKANVYWLTEIKPECSQWSDAEEPAWIWHFLSFSPCSFFFHRQSLSLSNNRSEKIKFDMYVCIFSDKSIFFWRVCNY